MTNIVATDADRVFELQTGDRLFVPEAVSIAADAAVVAALSATDHAVQVVVDGTVVSLSDSVIALNDDASGAGDNSVVIGATGNVRTLSPEDVAVSLFGSGNTLQNSGEVSGDGGIFLRGYRDGLVENAGRITAASLPGVFADFGSAGFRLINDGVISGADAIGFSADSSGTVTNTGQLFGGAGEGRGINAVGTSGAMKITNTGRIVGDADAIGTGSGSDIVRNSGDILGDVMLGGAGDIFAGRGGTVIGSVSGQNGNDLYIIDSTRLDIVEAPGEGDDTIRAADDYALPDNVETLRLIGAADIDGTGSAGDDEIIGNPGDNDLRGLAGADTISGGAGNDSIDGGNGRDTLSGDDGDDTVRGMRAADEIRGNQGDDVLVGGLDNDRILGGEDDDTIVGGDGADVMTGGLGQDTFVYRVVADSRAGAVDTITDFSLGEDLIDLRRLPDRIEISSNLAFTGTGNSLVIQELAGDTRLFVDVNADGSADMRIDLDGVTGLTASDFLL